ncbi:hypothetical protein JCM11491_006592 [Sporobolomyces phaffii]
MPCVNCYVNWAQTFVTDYAYPLLLALFAAIATRFSTSKRTPSSVAPRKDLARHDREMHQMASVKAPLTDEVNCPHCLATLKYKNSLVRHIKHIHGSRTEQGRRSCHRCHSAWTVEKDKTTRNRHEKFDCPVDKMGQVNAKFKWDSVARIFVRKGGQESAPLVAEPACPPSAVIDSSAEHSPPEKTSPVKPFLTSYHRIDTIDIPQSSANPTRPELDSPDPITPSPRSAILSEVHLPSDLECFLSDQDYSSVYFDSYPSAL